MGAILWLLQRVSGLILIAVVGLHVGIQYGFWGSPFRRPALLAVDWIMLMFVVYHGVNGLRTIAFDYIGDHGAQRLVNGALWAAGLVLLAYASWGLAVMAR